MKKQLPPGETDYKLVPIGVIESSIARRENAPCQGDEGGVEAWIIIDQTFEEALEGIAAGQHILILTWLHQSERSVLKVHPRGDKRNPVAGVFATRSPDRPNPIGLHEVKVLEVVGRRMKVFPLEAIDGTPVIDIKPVL